MPFIYSTNPKFFSKPLSLNSTVPSSNSTVPSSNSTVPSSNSTVPSSNTTVPSSNTTVPIDNQPASTPNSSVLDDPKTGSRHVHFAKNNQGLKKVNDLFQAIGMIAKVGEQATTF